MNFIDYIKGNRKGTDAHRIEKEAMQDPFMYEAIEGFDSIDDNHIERINRIHKRLHINKRPDNSRKRHHHMWQISAACAAAVIVFIAGGYFYKTSYQANLYSENVSNTGNDDIIKIYVPEEYYSENVTVIAKHNVEAVKAYIPDIHKRKATLSESEDKQTTSFEAKGVIDVYIPE